MKIFLAGGHGQLGQELQACQPPGMQIIAPHMDELDIGSLEAVRASVADRVPDWVINCAAYTAVDRAEEDRDTAFRANATGAGNLAQAARECNARMLHISTDFVFDGRHSMPYQPGDVPHPLGVYGASKLAGERAVLDELAERCVLIRTAWVYGVYGNNFVRTMLRLMQERDSLSIVCDQIGTPTWTGNFATAMWQCITKNISSGVYHWTDLGACSWYDFAVAIQEEGLAAGLLDKAVQIRPIPADEYPTLAKRPPFSVLDTSALRNALDTPGQHWRVALREMLARLAKEAQS